MGKLNELSTLTQWILYTNLIALLSFLGFYHGEKGQTVSILGSLFFIFNFLQMLVLFIFTQVKIFSSDIRECHSAAVDRNTGFVRQYDASLSYIVI